MPEVVDPLAAAVARLGLAELVVVVREAKVDAAGVDVEVVAEEVRSHHRALCDGVRARVRVSVRVRVRVRVSVRVRVRGEG